jgi:hypothetical protein
MKATSDCTRAPSTHERATGTPIVIPYAYPQQPSSDDDTGSRHTSRDTKQSQDRSVEKLVAEDDNIIQIKISLNFSCHSVCHIYNKIAIIDELDIAEIAKLLIMLRSSFVVLATLAACKLLSLVTKYGVNLPLSIEGYMAQHTLYPTTVKLFLANAVIKLVIFVVDFAGMVGLFAVRENTTISRIYVTLVLTGKLD